MSVTTAPPRTTPDPEGARLTARKPRYGEKVLTALLFACAAVSVFTTVAIVYVLFEEAIDFFRLDTISFVEFMTGTVWQPFGDPEGNAFAVGVLPLLNSTLLITVIAILVATPLGLGTAIYLSEYAKPKVRRVIKPVLELLAGMPTVVLGFFALTFVTPLLRDLLGIDRVPIFNALSAGLVVGVLIVPTIASISEDAMTAVPRALRDAGYGLGASRRHVALRVVFPAALSGIAAAILLGFGRAIGETLIVSLAAGNLPPRDIPTADPLQQIQTMTAYITQAVGGESSRGSVTFQSIFAVGALLFLITFLINLIAMRIVRRYREVY
ncbi:phosphate ABC transporter permease subunit PstC [Aquipuribacter sp. MA13-6]|uniref:phosphate ABC transporter permease subunit PstC n=1 Tax=unclassified Aquipuribacter TaxID=2635084 RepID=UPI003EEB1E17